MGGRTSSGFRGALLAALVAICLRALIPDGYMPMVSAGQVSVEFCPGGMLVSSSTSMPSMDMGAGGAAHHHHHGAAQGGVHYEQCLFGLALASAAPPAIVGLPVALLSPDLRPGFATTLRVPRAALGLPPVRGPPILS
jgi:Protein of unknown function (DUF2946).